MGNHSEIRKSLVHEALDTFLMHKCLQSCQHLALFATLPDLPSESAALLGICMVLECSSSFDQKRLVEAEHWLGLAVEAGWPEIAAHHTPSAFPVQVLTWRSLTFTDHRRRLFDSIRLTSPCHPGLQLAKAEAYLECGNASTEIFALLETINLNECQPLTAETAHLWRTWLLAEYAWWLGKDVAPFLNALAEAINHPIPPDNDPYSNAERRRVKHLAALLGLRIAMANKDSANARHWLDIASQLCPQNWETLYFTGLYSWFLGDRQKARGDLEHSLTANPFQKRVRSEFALLCSGQDEYQYLSELSGSHDVLASSAALLYQRGRLQEARQLLKRLNQSEEPFSVRLVWPQARQLRLQQGWQLRAHMAEATQDWANALQLWQTARNLPTPSGRQRSSADQRAHNLYLLGQTLGDTHEMPEEPAKRSVYVKFQRELGLLSANTHLVEDALFYRSIAAKDSAPANIADWLQLLHSAEWVEQAREQAPARLIGLGDRLWKAGLHREAWKAYLKGHCMALAPERWLYVELATLPDPTPAAMLNLLTQIPVLPEAAHVFPSGQLLLLRSLCMLAQQSPTLESVLQILEQARQTGLPPNLAEPVRLLTDILQKTNPPNLADLDITLPTWTVLLYAGLELISFPRGVQSLIRFSACYGEEWNDWCPIDPVRLLGQELQAVCKRQDAVAAEAVLRSADENNIRLPATWQVLAYVLCALTKACQKDLVAAQQAYESALFALQTEAA